MAVNIELVDRAKQQDQEAYAELVDLYADKVYAIAYGYVFNAADARDLVQEVFIKAFRSLSDLKNPAQFRAWLFTIANRKALDSLDKKQAPTCADPREIDQLAGVEGRPGATEQADEASTQSEVAQVLAALPDEHRVVLTLRYLEQMNYTQIAEALGTNVETVSNRLVRAKRYVKKHLPRTN